MTIIHDNNYMIIIDNDRGRPASMHRPARRRAPSFSPGPVTDTTRRALSWASIAINMYVYIYIYIYTSPSLYYTHMRMYIYIYIYIL